MLKVPSLAELMKKLAQMRILGGCTWPKHANSLRISQNARHQVLHSLVTNIQILMYLKLYPHLRLSDQEREQSYEPVGSGVDPNPSSEPHLMVSKKSNQFYIDWRTPNWIPKSTFSIVASTVPWSGLSPHNIALQVFWNETVISEHSSQHSYKASIIYLVRSRWVFNHSIPSRLRCAKTASMIAKSQIQNKSNCNTRALLSQTNNRWVNTFASC